MKKPYLEISILSIFDKDISDLEIISTIKDNILGYIPKKPRKVEIRDNNKVYFEFESLEDFSAMYEKDYQIYSYVLDEILQNNLDFKPNMFQKKKKKEINIPQNGLNDEIENYLVLKNKSNYLEPMRRNYNLIYRVNEILGSHVVVEEVQDGFLRFIRSQQDFEALLIETDEVVNWLKLFEVLQIDIDNPTIQKFITIIKSYLP